MALVGALVLLTAGCGEAPAHEASELVMPEVTWPDGKPSGAVEADEWARAYRELDLLFTLALAHMDFSDPDLVRAYGYDTTAAMAEYFRDEIFSPFAEDPTPDPDDVEYRSTIASEYSIIAVDPAADGASADVIICYPISDSETMVMSIPIRREPDSTYTLPPREPSGELPAPVCEISSIPVGQWDPPIVSPTNREDFITPLPREYYIELGVISE